MGIVETIIEIALLVFFVNMAYYWGRHDEKKRKITKRMRYTGKNMSRLS